MKYFKLPDLGEGLPEADILEWHIQEGDQVTTDQVLVSVETAKAIIEIPSPQDGEIAHLFGQAGDTIHTGEPLIEFANEEQEDTGTVVGEISAAEPASRQDNFIIGAAPSSRTHQQVQATPAVRALAQRLQVDLNNISGTGQSGHITPDDVQKAADMNRLHGPVEALKGVRKQMARTMSQSHAEVVPVTLFEDADLHNWPADSDITMRLIQAIAYACAEVPILNSWFDGQSMALRQHEAVQLGVAVDTDKGLFVPVLRDIGTRTTDDLRTGLECLRTDVRNRTIPASELQGATITLSNFGTLAGRYATPIIVPPQVAILGAGVVREQPVAVNGQLEIHRLMPLSLTFDHRVATGGEAARFLAALIKQLEQPFDEQL